MSTVTERVPLLQLPVDEYKRGLGVIKVERRHKQALLPLAGVSIDARVADRVASVTVKQKFRNTFDEHLEAIYIFPLAGGCVVSDFEMRVAGRVIKGMVKERAEARMDYQAALQQGKRTALLEQERDDVFTMQVGNVPPSEEVEVSLTYSERLPFFEDGRTELRLPLVVGERYVPGANVIRPDVGYGTESDTDIVPDASRITPPLLAQGFDPKVDLKIVVEVLPGDNGATVSDLACSQHATRLSVNGGGLNVELAREDERLNRDFVLQWKIAGDSLKSTLMVFHREDGDYGMLSIIPPKREGYLGAARDVLFLIDRSGSMQGIKMTSAIRACSALMATLSPRDRFSLCTFANCPEWLPLQNLENCDGMFAPADDGNIEVAQKWLRNIFALGGTEMYEALRGALQQLDWRKDKQGRVPVVVILTDGEVADESRILKLIQQQMLDARLFTVGIDTAVNSGLLKRMANLGGGTTAFVQPGAGLEGALQAIGREIGHPLVTDLRLETGHGTDVDAASIAPGRVPDLFVGRASTVFFKLAGKGAVRVVGKFADGSSFDTKVKQTAVEMPAIAQLWAKARIVEVEDEFRVQGTDALKQQIIDIAVHHCLLTKFTAFVAVDEKEVVNKDGSVKTLVQPVEQAAGWDMYAGGAATPGAAPGAMRSRSAQNFAQDDSPGAMPRCFGSIGSVPSAGGWGGRSNQMIGGLSADSSGAPPVPPPNVSPPGQSPLKKAMANLPDFGKLNMGAITGKHKEVSPPAGTGAEARQRIRNLLDGLAKLLADALSELKKGQVPSPDELDKRRIELLQVLNTEEIGTETPELQKFLRAATIELIDSLRQKDVTAAALLPLWERHLKAFERAQAATTRQLERPAGGSDDKFWEATV